MKRFFVMMLAVGLLLGGCASEKAYQGYRESFNAAAEGYYKAAAKPLVDIELPAPGNGGKVYHIVVNREVKQMALAQIKDSEWVTPVAAGVGIAGGVANNLVTSHYSSKNMKYITSAIGGGVNTNGGDAYITDSYNEQIVTSAGDATVTQGGSPGSSSEGGEGEEGAGGRCRDNDSCPDGSVCSRNDGEVGECIAE